MRRAGPFSARRTARSFPSPAPCRRQGEGTLLVYGIRAGAFLAGGAGPEAIKVEVRLVESTGAETQIQARFGEQKLVAVFRERLDVSIGTSLKLTPDLEPRRPPVRPGNCCAPEMIDQREDTASSIARCRDRCNPRRKIRQGGLFDASVPATMMVDPGEVVVVETLSGEPWDLPQDGEYEVLPEHEPVLNDCERGPGQHLVTGPGSAQARGTSGAMSPRR